MHVKQIEKKRYLKLEPATDDMSEQFTVKPETDYETSSCGSE
jgi:hypothetical protein